MKKGAQKDAGAPRISVVVPTCNRADLIAACVEALARQTYARDLFEIIVVDDGSTDGTPAALEALAQGDPGLGLRVLVNERNIGANPSRNRGIREAKGDLVAFLDSDCIPERDWLERIVDAFSDQQIAAVVGLVTDPAPRNVWDLAFRGTHRVGKAGPAPRLILGNTAIRRELLVRYLLDEDYAFKADARGGAPDTATSGRSDEEGLYLRMRAAGHRMVANPKAVVLHDHHYTADSFFRQAYRGGRSAARLVYKFRLPHRTDMLPFMLAYGSLGASLVNPFLLPLFPVLLSGAMAAITYNDLFRKEKTPRETALSFPALVAYYHVRFFGYARQTLALRLGKDDIERVRL
jgi:glycosyltransferase involved in cell wall biosynthesis